MKEETGINKKSYGYISTCSGRKLEFLLPQPEQICLKDIARGLSNTCRYSGQIPCFYSVAQHSCIMAEYFINKGDYTNALISLFHDASEAYLTDIPRPMKPYINGYSQYEENLSRIINQKYGVPKITEEVKWLDYNIVRDEAEFLFDEAPEWTKDYGKINVKLNVCWTPLGGYNNFISLYNQIMENL